MRVPNTIFKFMRKGKPLATKKTPVSVTKTTVDTTEVIIIKKKTVYEFIATELAVYISQIFMFIVVAVLTSNMLKDETALTNYTKSKLNEHTVEEIGCILVATIFTIGMLSAIAKTIKQSKWLETLSDEVLNEAPRAIYFFGSSATGTLIAVAIFSYNHPTLKAPTAGAWFFLAAFFSLGAFLYGCGISYAFKYKTHIK